MATIETKRITELPVAVSVSGTEAIPLVQDSVTKQTTLQTIADQMLVGPTGPTGPAGADGVPGPVGATGPTGPAYAPSVQTVTSSATVTPVATNDKVVISAQATDLTLANPSGLAAEGQGFVVALKDDGTARGITFDSDYREMGATFPTTTVLGKWLYIPVMYNATDDKWDVFVSSQQT